MYSHFSYFLYIVAMLYFSEDEEFLDEDSSRRASPRPSACGVLFHCVDL
jgi:hypothetical protein